MLAQPVFKILLVPTKLFAGVAFLPLLVPAASHSATGPIVNESYTLHIFFRKEKQPWCDKIRHFLGVFNALHKTVIYNVPRPGNRWGRRRRKKNFLFFTFNDGAL